MNFERVSVDGHEFTIVPAQQGVAMSKAVFEARFEAACEKCIQRLGSPWNKTHTIYELLFSIERQVYNGEKLYGDEVVLYPNSTRVIGEDLREDEALGLLWEYERYPRYVHLIVTACNEGQVHFWIQASCCLCSIYDPRHPNPTFPMQSLVRGDL